MDASRRAFWPPLDAPCFQIDDGAPVAAAKAIIVGWRSVPARDARTIGVFLASMIPYMQANDIPVPERVLEHFRRCEARPAYQRAHLRCYPDGVTTP